MTEVFRENVCRVYSAPFCSFAHFFSVATSVLAIILPFFLAYPFHNNGTIWMKEDTYWEQPDVEYRYEFIAVLNAKQQGSDNLKEIYYSTEAARNQLSSYNSRTALIRSQDIDENVDGLTDKIICNVVIPLEDNEEIYSVEAILLASYRLKDRIKLNTEALIHVQKDSGIPRKGFYAVSDIELKQAYPMEIRNYFSTIYEEDPLFDGDSTDQRLGSIHKIMEHFHQRQYSAGSRNKYTAWTNNEDDKKFKLKMIVNVPTQQVRYIPKTAEVIKAAWIKYLSILVITSYIVRSSSSFIFSQQL